MARMRLDKLLAEAGFGSRTEVKELVRRKRVRLDGQVVRDPSMSVDSAKAEIYVDERQVRWQEFYYLLMNKPDGVISATEDDYHETVLDLIPAEYKHADVFPVGRLDRDSEGLLILTNDGQLAHRLLSPKRHVPKVYYVIVNGQVTTEDVTKFRQGIQLEDFTAQPADLKILESAQQQSKAEVTIHEGKFHQVKRMFAAVGKQVTHLKRIKMGPLELDPTLMPGDVRELTPQEVEALKTYQPGQED